MFTEKAAISVLSIDQAHSKSNNRKSSVAVSTIRGVPIFNLGPLTLTPLVLDLTLHLCIYVLEFETIGLPPFYRRICLIIVVY